MSQLQNRNNDFLTDKIASHPTYKNYEDLLEPGWILGRKVDNSDSQYSSFRDNIPYLAVLLVLHPLLRRIYNLFNPLPQTAPTSGTTTYIANPSAQSAVANARLKQRINYDLSFAAIFLCALHGFSALKVFTILSANFLIATKLPRGYVVPLTWGFNITVLFANELCHGYPYTDIALVTLPWTVWDPHSNWGTFFDEHSGLMPRWEILFNITVLRLISFNMDYYWSLNQDGTSSPVEVSIEVLLLLILLTDIEETA